MHLSGPHASSGMLPSAHFIEFGMEPYQESRRRPLIRYVWEAGGHNSHRASGSTDESHSRTMHKETVPLFSWRKYTYVLESPRFKAKYDRRRRCISFGALFSQRSFIEHLEAVCECQSDYRQRYSRAVSSFHWRNDCLPADRVCELPG